MIPQFPFLALVLNKIPVCVNTHVIFSDDTSIIHNVHIDGSQFVSISRENEKNTTTTHKEDAPDDINTHWITATFRFSSITEKDLLHPRIIRVHATMRIGVWTAGKCVASVRRPSCSLGQRSHFF